MKSYIGIVTLPDCPEADYVSNVNIYVRMHKFCFVNFYIFQCLRACEKMHINNIVCHKICVFSALMYESSTS